MPPLKAFQSGVGDGSDLKVKIHQETTARETFTYDIQIKAVEEKTISYYPEREFQYRFKALLNGATVIETPYYIGTLDGEEPFQKDGDGKKDLKVPLEIILPDSHAGMTVAVEILDPSNSIQFSFEKGIGTATPYADDYVTFYTTDSAKSTQVIEVPYYGPRIKGKPFYVLNRQERLIVSDTLPGPMYDPVLSNVNAAYWTVLVYPSNPNVQIRMISDLGDYTLIRKFFHIKMEASIVSLTQTPWNPLIHNGYYYLNEAEHFLYSESRVEGKAASDIGYAPLEFTYGIRVNGFRLVPGGPLNWRDEYISHYKGEFSGTTMTRYPGELSLLFGSNTGSYTSEPKVFPSTAVSYDTVDWDIQVRGTSSYEVFVQNKDINDEQWQSWVKVNKGDTIPVDLAKEIRYKINMNAGTYTEDTVTEFMDTESSDFYIGYYQNNSPSLKSNVEILDGYVLLEDASQPNGVYTSATFEVGDHIWDMGNFTYVSFIPEGTGGNIEVFTAAQLYDRDWESAAWMPLSDTVKTGESTTGKIASPKNRYFRYQVRFTRSSSGLSPLFHSAYFRMNTYNEFQDSPRVKWIKLGGTFSDTYVQENYTKTVAATIPTDGEVHQLGEDTIKNIMDEYLLQENPLSSGYLIDGYEIVSNIEYGVHLTSRDPEASEVEFPVEIENGVVFGQTTNIAQEYVYNQLKITLDDSNQALVSPVPQQGLPIIVEDDRGVLYRQVFFLDEYGRQTLSTKEVFDLQDTGSILLAYQDVDPDTLFIEKWVVTTDDLTGKSTGKWEIVTDYEFGGNQIVFPSVFTEPTQIRLEYKLANSFYLLYNWSTKDDYAKMAVHSSYLSGSNDKTIKVSYETNKKGNHYLANEVNLNPLYNIHHEGFLYLTNEVYPVQRLDVVVNPDVLYTSGYDMAFIRVVAKDRYGNPVSGEDVSFTTTLGTIEIVQERTDQNGIAIAKLSAGTQSGNAVIRVSCAGHEYRQTLSIRERKEPIRISLTSNQPTIKAGGEEVEIKALLFGENNEPLANSLITFATSDGELDEQEVKTNYFGEATVLLRTEDIPETGMLYVSASHSGQREEIGIRIFGFLEYHNDYFYQSNNLIDLFDRMKAKENLGIVAGNVPSPNPQAGDIWFDISDIPYIMQSYHLKDILDRAAAKVNLGISVGYDEPQNAQGNDIWIENKEEE